MKYFLIVILWLNIYSASAQKVANNIDTVYYLLDTTNTTPKDRMWDVGIESQYKYFTVKCPCLKYNSEPTFVYNLKDSGQSVSNASLSKIRMVSLPTLIDFAKKTTDLTAQTLCVFYIVEIGKDHEYIVHKTRLLTPRKREASVDFENVTPMPDKKRRNK